MLSQQKKTYTVLGLMSGTSLDGLDICAVDFTTTDKHKRFNIVAAETISYSDFWINQLRNADQLSGQDLIALDRSYGDYLGNTINYFLKENNLSVDLIASHGHTVFHQTEGGFSLQIGCGANIAAITESIAITDFRSLDVALKGQGAPLVPASEKILFPEYSAFLNLGGIANYSDHLNGITFAFDICPANMLLNYISSKKLQLPYDEGGKIASQGKKLPELYDRLNDLDYYQIEGPKSLGKEYLDEHVYPLIDLFIPAKDLLHTCVLHIVYQLKNNLPNKQILVTGGGAYNSFLMKQLELYGVDYTIPSQKIIEFKEALIFAHLGLGRFLGEINTMKSVTGANRSSIGGAVYDGRSL